MPSRRDPRPGPRAAIGAADFRVVLSAYRAPAGQWDEGFGTDRRPWTLDALPMILPSAEWEGLATI